MSTRADARGRLVRRAGLIAAVLAIIALLFLATGHWIIGVVLGIAAAVAVWVFFQVRTVR
jgi:hypothetical protein